METTQDDLRCPVCRAQTVPQESRTGAFGRLSLSSWRLNPGLAINELVLGQAISSAVFVCESCPGSLLERGYLWCPHCRVLKANRRWAAAGRFGHWLGWICPDCGQPTPRVWNYWSLGILAVTWPLWRPFRSRVRPRFLAWELRRMNRTPPPPMTEERLRRRPSVLIGMAFWGLPMFAVFAAATWAVSRWAEHTTGRPVPIDAGTYAFEAVLFLAGGAVVGGVTKWLTLRELFRRNPR